MGATQRTSLRDDFERWAQLSARMLRRPVTECARLARDAGVEGEWNGADAHWYAVLLDDIEAGRLERITRYRELCRSQLETRAREGAIVPSPVDALLDQPADPTPVFARRLVSQGIQPVEPSLGQTGTRIDLQATASAARVVAEALSWTLEQYAWLRAELERFPERAEEIWALRHVDDERARRIIVDDWQKRLDDAPEQSAHYEELIAHYRNVLASR